MTVTTIKRVVGEGLMFLMGFQLAAALFLHYQTAWICFGLLLFCRAVQAL